MAAHTPNLGIAYKNTKYSDIKVQIWCALKEDAASPTPPTAIPAKRKAPARSAGAKRAKATPTAKSAAHDKGLPDARTEELVEELVEELPGHRVIFLAASEYFRAVLDWPEEPDVIKIVVASDQVNAARQLLYFVYHGVVQEDGLSLQDIANLAKLADQYQMVRCTQQCIQRLISIVDADYDIEAALMACCVLQHVGSVSAAVAEPLFEFIDQRQHQLRQIFAALANAESTANVEIAAHAANPANVGIPANAANPANVEVAANAANPANVEVAAHAANTESSANPTKEADVGCSHGSSESVFVRTIAILRAMFQQMDVVWVQEKYRKLLHLFPVQVLLGLLDWDGLQCSSENVIVSAITRWLEAQPYGSVEIDVDVALQRKLLQVVRTPYMSVSYRCAVFPNLTWVRSLDGRVNELIAVGNYASEMPRSKWRQLVTDSKDCDERNTMLKIMRAPREYQSGSVDFKLEWSVPWTVIESIRCKAQEDGRGYGLTSPVGWCNGVEVSMELSIHKLAASGGQAQAEEYDFMFVVGWMWREPSLCSDVKPALASKYSFSFVNSHKASIESAGSGSTVDLDNIDLDDEFKWESTVDFVQADHVSGSSDVYPSYPHEQAKVYAQNGIHLNCLLTITQLE